VTPPKKKAAKTPAFTIGMGVSLYAMPVRACEIDSPPQGPVFEAKSGV
jgi:hypothetical protein